MHRPTSFDYRRPRLIRNDRKFGRLWRQRYSLLARELFSYACPSNSRGRFGGEKIDHCIRGCNRRYRDCGLRGRNHRRSASGRSRGLRRRPNICEFLQMWPSSTAALFGLQLPSWLHKSHGSEPTSLGAGVCNSADKAATTFRQGRTWQGRDVG
jgi:hypothetical protein